MAKNKCIQDKIGYMTNDWKLLISLPGFFYHNDNGVSEIPDAYPDIISLCKNTSSKKAIEEIIYLVEKNSGPFQLTILAKHLDISTTLLYRIKNFLINEEYAYTVNGPGKKFTLNMSRLNELKRSLNWRKQKHFSKLQHI